MDLPPSNRHFGQEPAVVLNPEPHESNQSPGILFLLILLCICVAWVPVGEEKTTRDFLVGRVEGYKPLIRSRYRGDDDIKTGF
jgi:hypothetical protein